MRIVGRVALAKFAKAHPDVESVLQAWESEILQGKWKTFQELRTYYPRADYVGNGAFVFDLRHNRYRLLARFDLNVGLCIVEKIGTHKEYDNWKL